MKIGKQWIGVGALGLVLLAGCASHGYVRDDDDYYHRHHRYAHREYRQEYVGRPPGYYEGQGPVDVYVAPAPVRPNRW